MIAALLALVMSAPAPLTVCVYGRSIDAAALHDALRIEAKKIGREAVVSLAQSRAVCRSIAPEVVVELGEVAVVSAGPHETSVDLRGLARDERAEELARVALAELEPPVEALPIVDEALRPLPAVPLQRQHVVREPTVVVPSPSRMFAGVGLTSRGDRWLPDLELGGWLPLSSSLALGLRLAHLPYHELDDDVLRVGRLEVATHVMLEARVPLDDELALAFQVGGGVVWRQTEILDEQLAEVVGSGLGALELRWDVARPLYFALALQGSIYSGGHDYQTFVDARVASAPPAPRGAFGAVLRAGAWW